MIRSLRFKSALAGTVLALAGLVGAAPAQALLPGIEDGGPYAQAFIGGTFQGEVEEATTGGTFVLERDSSVVGGGAVGFQAPILPFVAVRTEIEGSYAPINVDAPLAGSAFSGTEADLFGALANFWLDLNTPFGFTPYAGGGVGIGLLDFEGSNNNEVGIAYQVGGGVLANIPLTPFFVGANYRYFMFQTEVDDVPGLGNVDVDLDGHRGTISIGIQF